MNENQRICELNDLFFDYLSYLVFMARQILGTSSSYGHFSLIKALEKILEIQTLSNELDYDEFCDRIRDEMKLVEETSSGDIETWEPFLDKLISIFIDEMKSTSAI